MSKKRSRARRSRKEWQNIIDDQPASEKSVVQYCLEHKVSEKSFYAWRQRLRSRPHAESERFVQIHSEPQCSNSVLEIHTPDGYRLAVPQGTDGEYVKMILGALRA